MAGAIDTKLQQLGITLPEPAAALANYLPTTRSGQLVVVSGQLPMQNGQIACVGKLGAEISVEQGVQAARLCLLNVLAQLRAAAGGSLDGVRVLRLGGFIAGGPDFHDHAQVMNGASDLAVEIFGDAGRHARSTIGVSALPRNAAVEVEGLFELPANGPLDSPLLA